MDSDGATKSYYAEELALLEDEKNIKSPVSPPSKRNSKRWPAAHYNTEVTGNNEVRLGVKPDNHNDLRESGLASGGLGGLPWKG